MTGSPMLGAGAGDVVEVWCFGGATMDRQLRAVEPLRAEDSNPVLTRSTPGGVARNVAEALARLGCRTGLVSAVGEDGDGWAIIDGLVAAGVDTSRVRRAADRATACYTAVLEPDGALALGTIDAAILGSLDPGWLGGLDLPLADAWLVDANLSAPALVALLARPDRPPLVAADAVSAAKVLRLAPVLEQLDLLFLNVLEARALLCDERADETALARALVDRGAAQVVLNLGKMGAVVASKKENYHVPAVRARVVDVTGAGDTAAAATLAGLLDGRSLVDAVRLGRAAAAMAIESDRPVPPAISLAALQARVGG